MEVATAAAPWRRDDGDRAPPAVGPRTEQARTRGGGQDDGVPARAPLPAARSARGQQRAEERRVLAARRCRRAVDRGVQRRRRQDRAAWRATRASYECTAPARKTS